MSVKIFNIQFSIFNSQWAFLLLLPQYCYGSAGSANDEIFFILVIIAVMLFILLVLYSIDFVRKIIRERKKENNIENERQELENEN